MTDLSEVPRLQVVGAEPPLSMSIALEDRDRLSNYGSVDMQVLDSVFSGLTGMEA